MDLQHCALTKQEDAANQKEAGEGELGFLDRRGLPRFPMDLARAAAVGEHGLVACRQPWTEGSPHSVAESTAVSGNLEGAANCLTVDRNVDSR